MILRVSDVSASFGSRRVLNGVTFDLERGRAVALAGPNGAGKTTLLRCILGLIRHSGRIEVDGLDARSRGPRARARLGYVPQSPAFYDLTALEFLRFVGRLRGASDDAAGPVLERIGLAGDADRLVRVFSGGMQQRLSLGAALLGDPPVLLLDEPTANLDPEGREDLMRLLDGFRAEGKTLLFSSHRKDEIRALADRVLLLKDGSAAAYGPPGDVFPGDPVEVDVQAPDAAEKRRLADLLAKIGVTAPPSLNGAIHLRLDTARVIDVVDLLRNGGVAPSRIRLRPDDRRTSE